MKPFQKVFVLLIIILLVIVVFGYITGISGRLLQNMTAFLPMSTDASENEISSTTIEAKATPEPTPVPTPQPTAAPILRLIAVGDIMMGRSVGKRLEDSPNGYDAAFINVSDILNSGDVTFANLEAPMTTNLHSLSKNNKIILKCSPDCIGAIKSAGFDILSLANNHMMDYYDNGLFDTIGLLDKNGIGHSGAGSNLDDARKPVILEKNGVKIGFISYTDMAYTYPGNPSINYSADDDRAGLAPRRYELIKEDIDKLRPNVDLVAVSLHWGVEETFKITPEMVDFAHKLIDDGADMILGHHPHQFQGIEVYKQKPIIYSMGNFIFDQNDPENMETFIMDINFERNVIKSISAIPVRILNKSRAVKQKPEEANDFIKREIALCNELGTVCKLENDRLIFEIKQ